MVPVALGALGIQVEGDGSAEYEQMDENYRGVVRFKDFRRFVARRQSCSFVVDGNDSDDSESSLEGTEEVVRELWSEIDP